MKKKLLLFLIFLLCEPGLGFSQHISIGAGLNYGGPIPTEAVDSTSGKPIAGLIAGASYSIPLNERFAFLPGLYYSFRGLEYSQSFTRDTLFTVEINGTSGQVPSFYTAYVDGSMHLHYIDIPLLVTVRVFKFQMMFGPYFSILVAGKDAGNVRVVIGSGGFYDDYTDVFSNYSAIRKVEQGFMLGSSMPVYKNFGVDVRVSRSFFTLYHPDRLPDRGQGTFRMYNTFMHLGLVYELRRD